MKYLPYNEMLARVERCGLSSGQPTRLRIRQPPFEYWHSYYCHVYLSNRPSASSNQCVVPTGNGSVLPAVYSQLSFSYPQERANKQQHTSGSAMGSARQSREGIPMQVSDLLNEIENLL